MSENVWPVAVGESAVFLPYLTNDKGKPILTYTGSEPVRVEVWQGDDMAPIAGVATIAFDATQALTGQTTVTIHGTGTAALTPGWYLIRCSIASGAEWYAFYEGFLQLQDAPGLAVAPPVYCTVQDMLDQGGTWLPKLMTDLGRTNFIADRARAKAHIDKVILAKPRMQWGAGSGWIDSLSYSNTLYGAELADPYISGLLAAGTALIRSDSLVSAAAYYSLFLVCEKAFTWDSGDPFAMRARYFKARFNQVILSTLAEFDVNGDGVADFAVNLGRISMR